MPKQIVTEGSKTLIKKLVSRKFLVRAAVATVVAGVVTQYVRKSNSDAEIES